MSLGVVTAVAAIPGGGKHACSLSLTASSTFQYNRLLGCTKNLKKITHCNNESVNSQNWYRVQPSSLSLTASTHGLPSPGTAATAVTTPSDMEAVPATGARSHVPIERSLALASIELNLKQRKKGADFDVHLMSAAGQSPSRAAFIAASSIANHLMNTIPKLRGIGISAADRSTSGKIEVGSTNHELSIIN
ncbi:hypothetical protein FIBSPDRAFT_905595 [Athelia psychrophila]|uniref:Uncharacterized protein n=1 Tax=Athelia psychrophila TaxID=1759441 RepID=A0A167TAA8_9AGAM|nr:hypothetical protein FIBSPDRAFT_905595 [Fibularhizoctonia sp. CBS 109695]